MIRLTYITQEDEYRHQFVDSFSIVTDDAGVQQLHLGNEKIGPVTSFKSMCATHSLSTSRSHPEAPDAYQGSGRGLKDNGEF